ncbi:MAG: urea carboxylase-associated family protein [Thermoanaerobaculia bacterium]
MPLPRHGSAQAVTHEIPPRSGVAFTLHRGQQLRVIDPCGQQVADLLAFNREDLGEVLSSGRSIDYASKIYFSTGDPLYSNRSRVMLRIVEDMVGRHDFLLTPCSAEMFRILYGHQDPHRGCFGNLAAALKPFGVDPDRIPTAFNVFMNVPVNGRTGAITVEPPLSRAGDSTVFSAEMDLVIGLTACSAGLSNNFAFKPIHYEVS